jgi:hypothetical protein
VKEERNRPEEIDPWKEVSEGRLGRWTDRLLYYQSRIGNDNYAVNSNQISVVYYHIYKYRIMYIYFYDSSQNDADHSLCRIFVTIKRWLICVTSTENVCTILQSRAQKNKVRPQKNEKTHQPSSVGRRQEQEQKRITTTITR